MAMNKAIVRGARIIAKASPLMLEASKASVVPRQTNDALVNNIRTIGMIVPNATSLSLAQDKPMACERVGRSRERVIVSESQRRLYRAPMRWESELRTEGCVASPIASPRREMSSPCGDKSGLALLFDNLNMKTNQEPSQNV